MELLSYYWPMIVIVAANSFYHVASMNTSRKIEPFASLICSYFISIIICIIFFFITSDDNDIIASFGEANWATIALGICIVGLEFGFIMMYKVGWNLSVGSLVCNIALAVFLIIIGVLFYKDILTIKKLIGIALCIAGLILINTKEKE